MFSDLSDKEALSPEMTRESIKLAKRLNRNLGSIIQMTGIDKEAITADKCIRALKKPLTQRTIEDISILKAHLMRSDLNNRFKLDKVSNDNYDKLMVILATYANYAYIPDEVFLHKIGEKASFLYIIAQGSVTSFTMNSLVKYLSAYDYYCRLIQMKEAKDNEILIKTVKDNASIYPIDVNDVEVIELIVLKIIFNDIPNKNVKEDLEEVFPQTQIPPSALGIDFEQQGIFKINDIINDQLKHIPNEKVLQYRFLLNKTKQNYVTLYANELLETLTSGGVFGDSINGKYIHAAFVAQGTHLFKIDSILYGDQIAVEKNKTVNRDISFLHESFFLSKIPRKKFERDYFEFFQRTTYQKGQVIYKENEKINHLYFIQTGEIEMSSYHTIIEMHSLISNLNKLSMGPDDICFDFAIKNSPKDLLKNIAKKIRTKLFIIINQELLGVESWFKLPFLFTATAKSDCVELYRIPLGSLREILNDCNGVKEELQETVKEKLSFISKRLNNVNSTSLSLADKMFEVKEEEKVIHYKEKLLKDNQTVLNTKKMNEYRDSASNVLSNKHQSPKRSVDHSKERNEAKMPLMKNPSLNPSSIDSIIEKKRKVLLPKIQTANASFENRLINKLQQELHTNSSVANSLLPISPTVQNSSSIKNYTKPELSAFLTEVTQLDKNLHTERKHKRSTRNIRQEKSLTVGNKRPKVYRTPCTIAKLKKYSIFDQKQLDYSAGLKQQYNFYQFSTLDKSSPPMTPSNNLLQLFKRNKDFNIVIKSRRDEHMKYKRKMMDKMTIASNPSAFFK